jgi:hypothetical protein
MLGKVWEWLYEQGPATRSETARGIGAIPNNISSRLKELLDMGNVLEVGKDKCRVTGKKVTLYDVTSQRYVGQKPPKKKKKEIIFIRPKSCADCPLVMEKGGKEVCMMDLTLPVDYDHCPAQCGLCIKDVIISG